MSSLNIGDLVKRDQQGEFRNDVQLSSYDDPERNLSLVCSYLFTSSSPSGTSSSSHILFNSIEAFLNERLENRFTVIANYGHGKSHLALALANYFGKPFQSSEVQAILDKINKAYSNSPQALRYKEFKENRGEFLVIRIRGDVTGSLREQFLKGLEQELGEHNLTVTHLPGWYAKAEKYLSGLSSENKKKANQFLEQFEIDVPLLAQEVKQKRDRAYDIFANLYAHLDANGFKPDMSGEISLSQAITWAVKEFCGEGKSLGGVVILFDEFSLYVNNYAKRNAAGDLQDMLNGVSDNQGKVVFLAFAQQDPITTANNMLVEGGANNRDSLMKELTRIPKTFLLHSLMESVIDSYLEQPNEAWRQFLQEPGVSIPIAAATNTAYEQFRDRYVSLGWSSIQKFEEKVTMGCFPLHPITTALLCSMQFQQNVTGSGTPRNILGFILEKLDEIKDTPALIGNRINWILPIFLVDYFGERLPVEKYQSYINAIQRIDKEDENGLFCFDDQVDMIKALLLQEIAGLRARAEDQIDLIASMVGLPPSDTKKCLRSLSDAKIIAWGQDGRKAYSLWSLTFNPHKLDQILERNLGSVSLTWQDLVKFSIEKLKAIPVSIPWGNSQDWQAQEYIMDIGNFNSKSLKTLAKLFVTDSRNAIQDGNRGCVIWLIGRNENEVEIFKRDAQKILDETSSDPDPLPVVLMLSSHAHPSLLDALHRQKTLTSFSQTEKEEAGQEIYKARLLQEIINIDTAIQTLRGGENYLNNSLSTNGFVVPNPYQKHVQEIRQLNMYKLLEECYRVAYTFSPPEFFTQYSLTSRNFRTTVKTVSNHLLHHDSNSLSGAGRASPSAQDLINLIRQKWSLLTPDNRITESNQSHIDKAWELLEQTFPAGGLENLVKHVLIPLLNPPYGYDYNTLTLLFCIWYGYNSHDLEIRTKGRLMRGSLINATTLDTWLQAGPKEFINSLCTEDVTITRRDSTKIEQFVKEILSKVKIGGFYKTEADDAVVLLDDFSEDDRNDPALISDVINARKEIESGLQKYHDYETQAQKVLSGVNQEKSIKNLFALLQSLSTLTESTLVLPDSPSISDLRSRLMTWLEKVVDEKCSSLKQLRDITYLVHNRSQLEELRSELSKAGLLNLVESVDLSIQDLNLSGDELRDKAQELNIQTSIRAMMPNASLKDLQSYKRNLEEMKGLSMEILKLRDQQLGKIEEEIRMLEEFSNTALNELNNVTGIVDFEIFRDKLQKIEWRYGDTPNQKEIHKVSTRVSELRKFFDEVIQLSRQKVDNPDDAKETKRLLNSLGRKYLSVIGDMQRSLIEDSIRDLDKLIAKEEETAISWLEEIASQIQNSAKLPQLRNRLENPPAFLPEKERKRIDILLQEIDKSLDEDVIEMIASYFIKIKDQNIRKSCIARLEKLLAEKTE